jgi:O-antigen ligase
MSAFLKSCSIFERILFLYIGLLGLQGLLELPWVGNKLHVCDMLFPVLVFYFYKENKAHFNQIYLPKWPLVCLAVILDLGLISAIVNYNINSLVIALARYYLFSLGALVFIHFSNKSISFKFSFFSKAFISTAVIISLIGLIGYLLFQLGIENRLVYLYEDFPYLGDVYRIRAFYATPNKMVLLIGLALLFIFSKKDHKNRFLLLLIFGLTLSLAFAKGILLLVPVVSVYIFPRLFKSKVLKIGLWSSCATLFLLLCHFHFTTSNQAKKTHYSVGEVAFKFNTIRAIKTSYFYLKEQSMEAFRENPILGKGPGNFNNFIAQQKEKGKFPNHLYNLNPHSTWLGTLAELGIFAFLSLLFLAFYLIRGSLRMDKNIALNFVLPSFFLIILIESNTMDMLNFRFLYILLGLFILQIETASKKEKEIQ